MTMCSCAGSATPQETVAKRPAAATSGSTVSIHVGRIVYCSVRRGASHTLYPTLPPYTTIVIIVVLGGDQWAMICALVHPLARTRHRLRQTTPARCTSLGRSRSGTGACVAAAPPRTARGMGHGRTAPARACCRRCRGTPGTPTLQSCCLLQPLPVTPPPPVPRRRAAPCWWQDQRAGGCGEVEPGAAAAAGTAAGSLLPA